MSFSVPLARFDYVFRLCVTILRHRQRLGFFLARATFMFGIVRFARAAYSVLRGTPDFLVLVLSGMLQYGQRTMFSGKYLP